MNDKEFSKDRRRLMKAGAAASTALLLPSLSVARKHDYGIAGLKAPELDVSQWIDGKGKATSFKLADHKGKFILLKFFQAWCPGCHRHGFPSLKEISDAFKGNKHFTAVAVQTTFEGYFTNTPKKLRKIQKQYDLDLIFGHDEGNPKLDKNPKTMVDYRSGGTPWMVVIAPNGKVLFNDFHINAKGAIALLQKEIDTMG